MGPSDRARRGIGAPRRRWGLAACLVATALLAALAASAVVAGDAELARFLIAQARAALEKGKPDEAVDKLERALAEDPEAIEACWWLGQAHEKRDDADAARTAYRRAGDVLAARRRRGVATSLDDATAKKAEARLFAIAAGEAELHRLEAQYVAQLVALARSCLTSDPATAKRALDAALAVAPEAPEVVELLARLGVRGESAGTPAEAPGTWDDLLARKAFEAETIAYGGGAMTHHSPDGGEIAWASPQPKPGPTFALELELRFLERPGGPWLAGFAFFEVGERFFSYFLKDGHVGLYRRVADEHEDLARFDTPGDFDPAAWHAMRIVYDKDRTLTAFLDGKEVFSHQLPEGFEASGRIGLWTQRSKVEYRKARVKLK